MVSGKYIRTPEIREKMRLANIGKPGHPHTEEHKKRMSLVMRESHNGMWKADGITRRSLHEWLRRRLPEPDACEGCNKSGVRLDLANMTDVYDRNLDHWKYLCQQCHNEYDYWRRVKPSK